MAPSSFVSRRRSKLPGLAGLGSPPHPNNSRRAEFLADPLLANSEGEAQDILRLEDGPKTAGGAAGDGKSPKGGGGGGENQSSARLLRLFGAIYF